MEATIIGRFGRSKVAHRIQGDDYNYANVQSNRTRCGRSGLMSVERWQSGRPITVTCAACRKTH